MPERSGITIFAEDQFTATFKKYDKALGKAEGQAASTAKAITKSGRAQTKSFAGVGTSLGNLALKYASAAAVAYTFQRVISDAIAISTANEAAMQGLASSTSVAQREFGGAIGTTARWTARVQELSDELRVYSDTSVAQAITRTVDMTKRLGLSEAQMVEVIRRAGELGAGKTDLTSAVERVTAALRGEAESSEYLGLTLSETYVKTNAARLGFNKAWKEMGELEKAQVRYAAFLEQTNEVVGRAAASTDTLVGAQAELRREQERTATVMAENLIPMQMQWAKIQTEAVKAMPGIAQTAHQIVTLIEANAMRAVGVAEGLGQALVDVATGQGKPLADAWREISERGWDEYSKVILANLPKETKKAVEAMADVMPTEALITPLEAPDYGKIADTVESTLDRIQDMQRDHNLELQRETEDALREQERAWDDYGKSVAKTIKAGEKKVTKIMTEYEEDRAEELADYQEAIVEAEEDALDERLKAQGDFERQYKQSNERFQLDQLQSDRRYEYERAHLVAEGDTLAIEQLDELYKLEQQEAAENEDLQQKQAQENFDAQIKDMETAAQDLLSELSSGLEEQLDEQEAAYKEQLAEQQEANSERLAEMAAGFSEQRQLADEDRALAEAREAEDYKRRLSDLGEGLADQLEAEKFGAENVAALLEQFYGPGGASDLIMAGYHEREATRIAITAAQLEALGSAATIATTAPTFPSYTEPAGYGPGLQHGGIVQGPMSFHVESGVREAVIPLSGPGGAHHSVGWSGGPIPITGLEGASPGDINTIVREIACEITSGIRTSRRS